MPQKPKALFDKYKSIVDSKSGAQFVKVDLHVHTPASGDAQWKSRYNFKFDIKNIPKSLASAKKLADKIVAGAREKGLRLIAVTDHNTPSNTHPLDLTNSWYELLRDAAKGTDLCVLPGVEISTDDLHILVILDPKEEEPATYVTHRINFLLRDCKFGIEEYGDYKATGMSSLFDVLEYIEALGSECIAIPAHIDGGNKALISVYKNPGNVYNKLLNHPNLNAVEVVKDTTPTNKKIGGKKGKVIRDYFEGLRDDDRSPIAFIQDSDGHCIKDIGKRFSHIRMGEPGFWSLKNALEDPETRVRMVKDYNPDLTKTRILGVAFRKGTKWNQVVFNPNMNCIIGKKSTMKSALIDLILYGLNRFDAEDEQGEKILSEEEKQLIENKYAANVYIQKGSQVYCYSREGKGEPSIFKLKNDTFEPFSGKPDLELPRKYHHKTIEESLSDDSSLMKFFDGRIFKDDLEALIKKRNKATEKLIGKTTEECKSTDITKAKTASQNVFKKRKSTMISSLKKYGTRSKKNVFKVDIKEGKWKKGKIKKSAKFTEEYFIDKPTISLLVGNKYKTLKRLTTGERNGAIMVLLMNQGAFGPLIIDEPEQYLDATSVAGMVIPRIRKLKTQQQIICVTKDEHILLSGDAEQVIATQSEKKLEIVTGDINNTDIQKQILEIFEGDEKSLKDKNRKLGSILKE